jgi:hypothetical protein
MSTGHAACACECACGACAPEVMDVAGICPQAPDLMLPFV